MCFISFKLNCAHIIGIIHKECFNFIRDFFSFQFSKRYSHKRSNAGKTHKNVNMKRKRKEKKKTKISLDNEKQAEIETIIHKNKFLTAHNTKLKQFAANLQCSTSHRRHPVRAASIRDSPSQNCKRAVLQMLPHDPPEFDSSCVTYGKEIGKGVFGCVKTAQILTLSSTPIAAKIIARENSSVLDIQAERRILHAISGQPLFPYCFGFIRPNVILMQLIGSADGGIQTIHNMMGAKTLVAEDSTKICAQIVEGIGYLHQIMLLHNDVKCDNVVIEPSSRRPVVIDFGKATTIDCPRTYSLNAEEQTKYNVHHRHLAHELRNVPGTKQSVMTDTYSVGYLIKSIGHNIDVKLLYNLGRKLKTVDVSQRMSLDAAYDELEKLSRKK